MLKRKINLKKTSSLSSKKGLSRTGGKLKVKKKTDEEKELVNAQNQAMLDVFQRVWNKRGPYSESSGEYLGLECKTIFCHHLLSKSKYPQLRYEEENIMLLTWSEHSRVEAGYPDQKVIERTKQTKIRFNV